MNIICMYGYTTFVSEGFCIIYNWMTHRLINKNMQAGYKNSIEIENEKFNHLIKTSKFVIGVLQMDISNPISNSIFKILHCFGV
ncbi:hypothetical protein L2E82_19230 [Cichorium intybus]|uniref:Uncharacterized protein n=1 Tax=Cichorium intybus TaxID=13427 RepID=A0ACB9FAV8_CICIN|nr:hypothetical protein L2E82_19230 [Cichorium intybus]